MLTYAVLVEPRNPHLNRRLGGGSFHNPSAGDLIQGGRGLRKLRVPLTGRGKRGGARVIYYHWVNQSLCYLIYAYAKNVSADLTPDQLHKLATVMEKELNHG
jgi:hypothetical protein